MKVLVCTLFFFCRFASADVPNFLIDTDSARAVTLSARTSLILNRSFSHQLHQVTQQSAGYKIYSEPLSTSQIMPGAELAINAILNNKSPCSLFFETSYSFSQGKYRHFYNGMTDAEPPVYGNTSSELICHVKAHLLNLGAGLRWAVAKHFFFAVQVNFNYGLNVSVQEEGLQRDSEWTNFPSTPGAPSNFSNTAVSNIDWKRTVPTRAMSFRFSAGYDLTTSYGIHAFRNFGLGWQLPWWGLGCYKNF